MHERTLVLSLKPRFASKLMEGQKTVELRRVAPRRIKAGNFLLIYSTAPEASFVRFCRPTQIFQDSPEAFWPQVEPSARCDASMTGTSGAPPRRRTRDRATRPTTQAGLAGRRPQMQFQVTTKLSTPQQLRRHSAQASHPSMERTYKPRASPVESTPTSVDTSHLLT